MFPESASFSIEVEDFALVTYRVEADRIRKHLPNGLILQTFRDGGAEYGFVSTTCFLNRDFRLTAVGFPRHTFYESTYRTYIDYQGVPAVYFFRRYLGSGLSFIVQRTIDKGAYHADFEVKVVRGPTGYESYSCSATGRSGDTAFCLEAVRSPDLLPPWELDEGHAQFITSRPIGCFSTPLGHPARARVQHARMKPFWGRLTGARLQLWEELDVVTAHEAHSPYSVLISEGTTFRLFPPLPLRIIRSGKHPHDLATEPHGWSATAAIRPT